MVIILTPFEDPAEAPIHAAWTQAFYEALGPRAVGVYSNFLEAEGEARIREAYPDATYRRLAEVKRRYDPANLFRLNQNIRPATGVALRHCHASCRSERSSGRATLRCPRCGAARAAARSAARASH